jgi:hypothetical protein
VPNKVLWWLGSDRQAVPVLAVDRGDGSYSIAFTAMAGGAPTDRVVWMLGADGNVVPIRAKWNGDEPPTYRLAADVEGVAGGSISHTTLLDVLPDQHHPQQHAHTAADGSGPVSHADLTGVTPDQHHPQQHAHTAADGSGPVSHADLTGVTPDQHHAQSHAHDGLDGSGVLVEGIAEGTLTLRDSAVSLPQFRLQHASDGAGNSALIRIERSRGTHAAPTAVQAGDRLWQTTAHAWAGISPQWYRVYEQLGTVAAVGALGVEGRVRFSLGLVDGSARTLMDLRGGGVLLAPQADATVGIGMATPPAERLRVVGQQVVVANSPGAWAVRLQQTSASGDGVQVQPGADAREALTVLNAAGTNTVHTFRGNGEALLAQDAAGVVWVGRSEAPTAQLQVYGTTRIRGGGQGNSSLVLDPAGDVGQILFKDNVSGIHKYVRVFDGSLQVINSTYTAVRLMVTDAGQTAIKAMTPNNYALTVQQVDALGYGMYIKPGADDRVALAVTNAEGTGTVHTLQGNGVVQVGTPTLPIGQLEVWGLTRLRPADGTGDTWGGVLSQGGAGGTLRQVVQRLHDAKEVQFTLLNAAATGGWAWVMPGNAGYLDVQQIGVGTRLRLATDGTVTCFGRLVGQNTVWIQGGGHGNTSLVLDPAGDRGQILFKDNVSGIHKYVRVSSGSLQVINSAYTAVRLAVTDAGQTAITAATPNTYALTVQQTDALGYGMYIKPGADDRVALMVANAAFTVSQHEFFGNGSAQFAMQGVGTIMIGSVSPIWNNEKLSVYQPDTHSGSWAATTRSPNYGWLHYVGATSGILHSFRRVDSGSEVGSITHNGTATFYNTSSDRRWKRHLRPTRYGLTALRRIPVYDFEWLDGTAGTGCVAQEVHALYPEAVWQPPDPEQAWGLDYGKLTPLCIAAIQELAQRVERLEQRAA